MRAALLAPSSLTTSLLTPSLLTLSLIAVPHGTRAQTPEPTPPAPTMAAEGTLLDVQAEGKVARAPDLALVSAGVVAQAPRAEAAMRAQAEAMARVQAALARAGIAARDVQTTRVALQPQYRYAQDQAPVITGYQAASTVSLRFRDLARAGAVLDALVSAGANQIEGPSLAFADADAVLDEARAQALTRARARAELYAKAAGLRVARIVSIAEGGPGFAPPNPVAFTLARGAAKAETVLQPGESEVRATLSVRFLLR